MRQPEPKPKIYPGLKFTSVHFRMKAEVKEVRKEENEVDVILTSTDGNSWVEKNWNLQHMEWGLDKGEYQPIDKNEINYSVI